MNVAHMFQKDINRQINGVVKVDQNDDASIRQELEEYVVTRELQGHFAALYQSYAEALDEPTDRIGVWISGFFGSGKSHFLKMLSYVLANRVIDGKPAADYFDGKIQDPLVAAQVKRCAGVPTEAILFNIDSKGPVEKDKTAVLRIFARVFYEHQGFDGEDLRLTRLEQFVDSRGKTQDFREAFERINGDSWLEQRKSYVFFGEDVAQALAEAGVMSEGAAANWLDGTEAVEFSIESLVDDIQKYVERRKVETGDERFRLLFMADEVGQYIGSDVNLMLNLQTIVEELGARCVGSVWVMVTSQEAIDEVTHGIAGNDFSKIQGRFNTRLSLSSTSVNEVIQARVLAKTPEAAEVLRRQYAAQSAVLKNLFTFENAPGDLVGYAGERDFVAAFPFASYQFKVVQNVLTDVRKHGSSGKHLSGGERSMLSGFQEAAQRVQECDENALVPFWRFYDTLGTFLEGYIRRVIDRCAMAAKQGDQGLQPRDVDVLKLLFLLRHSSDIEANLNNIAILMADDMRADIVAVREEVKASLERLERQNYISRNGGVYAFLTDEEQDIAREIGDVRVDTSRVVGAIAGIVYGELYEARKLRRGSNDFPVDTYVDDQLHGSLQKGLTLRVVTAASDLHDAGAEALAMRSAANDGEAIVLLGGTDEYYERLVAALRIEQYARSKNISQLPETVQDIVRRKQGERRGLQAEAKRLIEDALYEARFFVAGQEVVVPSGKPKDRINYALERLVDHAYPRLSYIGRSVQEEIDVRRILLGGADVLGDDPNRQAVDEIEGYLKRRARMHAATSVLQIQGEFQAKPFGWRPLDVAATVAHMLRDQRVGATYAGVRINPQDAKLPGYLAGKSGADKLVIAVKVRVPENVVRAARGLAKDFAERQDVPADEDGLVGCVAQILDETLSELQGFQCNYEGDKGYPGAAAVSDGVALMGELLSVHRTGDAVAFLGAFTGHENDLLDLADDLRDLRGFFPAQQRVFDEARGLLKDMEREGEYVANDAAVQKQLELMRAIVSNVRPYGRIAELSSAIKAVRNAYNGLIGEQRRALVDQVDAIESDALAYAWGKEGADGVVSRVRELVLAQRDAIQRSDTLTGLDARSSQLSRLRGQFYMQIEQAHDAWEDERRRKKREAQRARVTVERPAGESPMRVSSVPVAASPVPQPKDVVRLQAPPERLETEEQIDAYVECLRQLLKDKLKGHDGVRLA